MNNGQRIVITGLGALSPNGIGRENYFAALASGRSGIRTITQFDASELPCRIAGEVDFHPEQWIDSKNIRHVSRVVPMAVVTRAAEPRRTERRVSRAIVLSFPRGRNGSRDEGLLDPPEYNAMYHLSRRNRNAVPPHRAKVVSGGRGGRHAVGAGACGRAEEVVLQVEQAVEARQAVQGRGAGGEQGGARWGGATMTPWCVSVTSAGKIGRRSLPER